MSKLACGLLSDKYSAPEVLPPLPGDEAKGEGKEEKDDDGVTACVSPDMFKALVGKGHAEFSSSRQQDAEEFFRHVLDQLGRTERTAVGATADGKRGVGGKVTSLFKLQLEDRLECDATKKVRYSRRCETVLSLPIPVEEATNKAEVDAYTERQHKRQKLDTGADEELAAALAMSMKDEGGADDVAMAEAKESKEEGKEAKGEDEEEKVKPVIEFESCLRQVCVRWNCPLNISVGSVRWI
jgi:hypothetical protein